MEADIGQIPEVALQDVKNLTDQLKGDFAITNIKGEVLLERQVDVVGREPVEHIPSSKSLVVITEVIRSCRRIGNPEIVAV